MSTNDIVWSKPNGHLELNTTPITATPEDESQITPPVEPPDGPQEPEAEPGVPEPELEPAGFASASIHVLKSPALDQRTFLISRLLATRQQRIKLENEVEETKSREHQLDAQIKAVEEYLSQCDMLAVVSKSIEPLLKTTFQEHKKEQKSHPRIKLSDDAKFTEGDLMKVFQTHPNTNLRPKEIVDFAPAPKKAAAKIVVYLALGRLVNKGWIKKVTEGVYRFDQAEKLASSTPVVVIAPKSEALHSALRSETSKPEGLESEAPVMPAPRGRPPKNITSLGAAKTAKNTLADAFAQAGIKGPKRVN